MRGANAEVIAVTTFSPQPDDTPVRPTCWSVTFDLRHCGVPQRPTASSIRTRIDGRQWTSNTVSTGAKRQPQLRPRVFAFASSARRGDRRARPWGAGGPTAVLRWMKALSLERLVCFDIAHRLAPTDSVNERVVVPRLQRRPGFMHDIDLLA